MKKRIILICASIIYFLCITGCSLVKELEFDVIYYEAMGYNAGDDMIGKDAVLLIRYEDYEKFTDAYFSKSQLPTDAPDKNNAVIILLIPSESNSVSLYYVKSVVTFENTLSVTIKKTKSEALVPRISGQNNTYRWVLFVEIDKRNLREDMEITVTTI